MDERTWERHANPWSVWTRVASFPLLLLAVWSHAWIGLWSIVAVALVALWLWLNPRLFPPPARTDGWSAMATFGERVWLNRGNVPIPADHARVASILSAVAALGIFPAFAGAFLNDLTMTAFGSAVVMLGKLWFCDRMVWLYRDMEDRHPPYATWRRPRSR
ncbi:hypothetical protein GDR74_05295 [Microvirga thermotolerans]|uniref:Uncharacterized protein n=2 Tax=Microvirga thermotolerans TaxID=2651334 RepID=A0A5P9K0F4_9HYPH|nr:hypothetical protein GDR74_05295 [Microvirga thermotolerans]